MLYKQYIFSETYVFTRWSRKTWALFSAIGKHVTIGAIALKLGDIAESIKSDKLSLTINSNNDTSYLITQIKKITFPGITDIDTADFNSENQFSIRNSPNPVSDYTTFKYSVSYPGDVTLLIYNFLGEIISRNYEGNKSPGKYSMLLDFKNLPSGIYYYRLLCGPETFTGEIVHKK